MAIDLIGVYRDLERLYAWAEDRSVHPFPPFKSGEFFLERASEECLKSCVNAIACHMGLSDCHFIVELVSLDGSEAGHIHTREYVGFTKIVVDRDLSLHPKSLMMVLAHELAHKFLMKHNLQRLDLQANERLTDAASVFLGFGMYAVCGQQYFSRCSNSVVTHRLGYLSDKEFLFACDAANYLNITRGGEASVADDGAVATLKDFRSAYEDMYPLCIKVGYEILEKMSVAAKAVSRFIAALDQLKRNGKPVDARQLVSGMEDVNQRRKQIECLAKKVMRTRDVSAHEQCLEKFSAVSARANALAERMEQLARPEKAPILEARLSKHVDQKSCIKDGDAMAGSQHRNSRTRHYRIGSLLDSVRSFYVDWPCRPHSAIAILLYNLAMILSLLVLIAVTVGSLVCLGCFLDWIWLVVSHRFG